MPDFLLTWLDPSFFPLLCGVIGLVVGSFLNVVIHRLPRMMDREWRVHCAELHGKTPPLSNRCRC